MRQRRTGSVIFDARIANCSFIEAPRAQLPSASAWGRPEAGDARLGIGSADLDVAFYRARVPAGMEESFILPPVPAKSLVPFGRVKAGARGDDLLLPQVAVLPMSFSWALHL